MIRGDSFEYELLEKWTKGFDCKGHYTCEIGVREGLGSKIIMDNVLNNNVHLGVDPYANIKYQHFDDGPEYTADYTDEMRNTLLYDFKPYRNEGKFKLYNMTDVLFMTHPNNQDMIFSFVHFDGPHSTKDVLREAVWFGDRSVKGSKFVFDDYYIYNMHLIAIVLKFWNFEIKERGRTKMLLERMK